MVIRCFGIDIEAGEWLPPPFFYLVDKNCSGTTVVDDDTTGLPNPCPYP
jgi:hypothetical protein